MATVIVSGEGLATATSPAVLGGNNAFKRFDGIAGRIRTVRSAITDGGNMEKNNVEYANGRPGAFPSYAFKLDYKQMPEKIKVSSPAVLHISKKRTDRRLYRRYPAARGAFALLRSASAIITDIHKMTMGDIAFAVMRSKPAKIGQIVNISMGGLMFQYAPEAQGSAKPGCLDILLVDCRYYLDNLNFEMVADVPSPYEFEFDSMKTGLISVKFKNLTAVQKKQLTHFLKNHTQPNS